jgi:molybdate/tungstate transport system substrate-binding protein
MNGLSKKLLVTMTGVAVCFLMAACGNTQNGSTGASNQGSTSNSSTKGLADVAYAGSLQLTNDKYIQPAFTKKTGLSYKGFGEGAEAVANLIKSKQITPNVFESIGTGPLKTAGTDKADWAVGFASSPLVVAYSNQSPYASQLKQIADGKKPISDLFKLMEQPNFHLGRTDPNTDPQGQYFVMMTRLAEKELHLPKGTADKILGSLENSTQVYPETDILSRLQSGQLDASSAYLPEAVQKGLPYIKLPASVNMGSSSYAKDYSTQSLTLSNGKTVTGSPIEVYITTVKGTKDQSAGTSFVNFVLSQQGLQIYRKMGYTITPAEIWGSKSNIPQSIQQEISK